MIYSSNSVRHLSVRNGVSSDNDVSNSNSTNSNSTNTNTNSNSSGSNHNPHDLTAIPNGSHKRLNLYDLDWSNKLAMIRVYETLEYYKVKPKSIDSTRGGEVVFRNISGWDRLVIRDVAFIHMKPTIHVDFLHIAHSCELHPDKAKQLHRISDSIMYNSVSKMLIASCGFVAASIGSFVIVKLFNNDDIHINTVSNLYDRVIIELHKEFKLSIGYLDQSKSPAPLRHVYEKYLHSKNMSFANLKRDLPNGCVLKKSSARRYKSPSRRSRSARSMSPRRSRKAKLSVIKS